ncbi:MAG TPA: hypothetical protein VKQ36_10545, partial [Ktedonobacterales bacterium]|nr:hypothetical protein [Ktedonobacterales bacterium]
MIIHQANGQYREEGELSTLRAPSLAQALQHWEAYTPDAPFIVEALTGRVVAYGAFAQAARRLRQVWGPTPGVIALGLAGGLPAALVWIAAL